MKHTTDTSHKKEDGNSSQNSDLLELQTNAQEQENNSNSSNDEIVERVRVENTPFTLIKVGGMGWFIGFSRHRVSEYFNTKEEVLSLIYEKDWRLLCTVISVIIENIDKLTDEEGK